VQSNSPYKVKKTGQTAECGVCNPSPQVVETGGW
jgi:hypothetical protein